MTISVVNDIKAGIEARIESLSDYTKASYQTDIAKNKFKGNKPLYAVTPDQAVQTEGLLGAFTLDHTFNLVLTNSYNAGAASQIGDSLKSSRITEIMDDILELYRDFCTNKNNIYSGILLINDLSIENAEFIEEEKVIYISFSINIKYKINK